MEFSKTSSMYGLLDAQRSQIRLLSIEDSGDSMIPIACIVQTFELNQAPRFDALSYVWGDQSLTESIYFCGRPRLITASLYEVLTRLRKPGFCKWLWIDAVCINQDDVVEKNSQIPLMRRIYRSAERVLSWLGEADKDTHLAFALIERWAEAILSTNPDSENWSDSRVRREAIKTIDRPFDEKEWTAFMTFTKRRYWERLWILQEVTLARQCILICGVHELRFDKLMWTYRAWMTGNLHLPQLTRLVGPVGEGTTFYSFINVPLEEGAFVKIRVEPSAERELREFPFLLKRASALSATDPKDKVYGILGLLDLASGMIPVDYGTDTIATYKDTLLTLARATGRLDLLSFAGQLGVTSRDSKDQSWPSWIPNLASTDKRDINDRFAESSLYYNIFFFNASGGTVAQCGVDAETDNILRVRGILLEGIAAVTQPLPREDVRERFRSWLDFTIQRAGQIKPRDLHPLQILFRTMIADHLWRGTKFPEFLAPHLGESFFRFAAGFLLLAKEVLEGEYSAHFEEGEVASLRSPPQLPKLSKTRLRGWLYSTENESKANGPSQQSLQVKEFLSQEYLHWPDGVDVNDAGNKDFYLSEFYSVFSRTEPRCLFITKEGLLGAGPRDSKIGDNLFLPQGCFVPLVIRPSGESFEVVADALIGGTMQGEIFQDRNRRVTEITLK